MEHPAGSPGTTWMYSWLVDMFDLPVDRSEQCRCPLRFSTEVATELLGQSSRAQTRLLLPDGTDCRDGKSQTHPRISCPCVGRRRGLGDRFVRTGQFRAARGYAGPRGA